MDTQSTSSPCNSGQRSATVNDGEKFPGSFKGTGITFDDRMGMFSCSWDERYPEIPERLLKSIEKCKEYGLIDRCIKINSRKATEEELLLQHTAEHVAFLSCIDQITNQEKLKELSSRFDSIRFGPNLYDAALLSVGSLIVLVDQIFSNQITNGMAIIRPPGHHAMAGEVCGYCYFNNVAVATKHLLNKGLQRVLIVDWDIHHGNGIQDMFYDDPRVLYFSIHRYNHGEFWPHLRSSDTDYVGSGDGEGFNINVPMNEEGAGNEDYMAIFHQVLMLVAYEFSPQFVLVSSGYDAALGHYEGGMKLTPPFYSHMIHSLMGLAESKVCVALEGGYFLPSLAEGVALTLRTLLGDPCPNIGSLPTPKLSTIETISDVISCHRKYWKCFSWAPAAEDKGENSAERVFRGKTQRDIRFPIIDDDQFDHDSGSQVKLIMKNTQLTFPSIRTCLVYDLRMTNHVNFVDRSHPERPERIRRIYAKHKEMDLLQRCQILNSRSATDSELKLVHSERHIDFLRSISKTKPRQIYQVANQYKSVYLCQNSDEAARLAAGCLLQVVDSVLSNECRNGIAIVRPPGHHAEIDKPMGFCLYNNVAVAAQYAITKYNISRMLILDWDVHHGNGIQHMFESDPRVLYMSLHRYDNGLFFPLSQDGNYDVVGSGAGEGYNVNIPWNKPGVGDSEYLSAFSHVILPIAYQFDPELVLVSAGFDAAAGDPLGGCKVTPAGYAQMTHLLSSLARGKVILTLEGGYNLSATAYSMCSCTKTLLGDCCPKIDSHVLPSSSAMKSINNAIEAQSKYWSVLQRKGKSMLLEDESSLSSISTYSSDSEDSTNSEMSDEPKYEDVGDICNELSTLKVSSDVESVDEGATAKLSASNKMFILSNEDVLVDELPYCVVPLTWCPHLDQHVRAMPQEKFDVFQPCLQCNNCSENWICLSCYKVYCGRYVNQHMLNHCMESKHQMTLSFSDLSVWCYGCESYVHHQVLLQAKNVAHESKFGMSIPTPGNS